MMNTKLIASCLLLCSLYGCTASNNGGDNTGAGDSASDGQTDKTPQQSQQDPGRAP